MAQVDEKPAMNDSSRGVVDTEKATTVHGLPEESHLDFLDDPDEGLSEEERAKIVSMHSSPMIVVEINGGFNRTNVGNAKLAGLQEDLHMTNSQYNDSLTIFFVSYAIFEPITNVLLKRMRPSVRWFLGLAEAGLFPGVGYFLSCWYKRSEFGVRMAIFFSAAALAGSFGGLLAAAIALMDGIGGKSGWSWIFILEGLLTIVIGVLSVWMVYDFPDQAKFLSEADRKRVLRRLAADKQASAGYEKFEMTYFWSSLKDWKTYLNAFIYMGSCMPLYAFSLFTPTIINELDLTDVGYTAIQAQLLSVPPYAAAAIVTVAIGFIADRTGQRGICNIAVSVLGIAGFSLLLGASSAGARYAGVFLGAMGIYPAISNTISWASNNSEGMHLLTMENQWLTLTGVYKRGVTLGIVIGWGNLNGVVSSNIYRGADAPQFYPGHGTVLAYLVLFLFGGSVVQYVLLRRENAKRRRGDRDHWVAGLERQEIEKLGDKRPDFIYTL
ncbi:hypothetical protein AbraCBS73388_001460 [Aspergillus brasiliensis]|uniref:Major facilitator superfamily (MFS) profile domain-containing protein n=1 Tax=Aspergillus brasiliensis TaxID=319629 RepID=A0A9W5YKW2_9EURO|nr:hypothetical protein AbraCBS73388_001460 [Aspergillus brasiliensis]